MNIGPLGECHVRLLLLQLQQIAANSLEPEATPIYPMIFKTFKAKYIHLVNTELILFLAKIKIHVPGTGGMISGSLDNQLSLLFVNGGMIPTTLDGSFKRTIIGLDNTFRGHAIYLPETDPGV